MEAGSSVWLSRWFEDSASIDESENSSSINCALHPQWPCQMSGGKCWNSYLERCNYQWSKTDQHFNNTTYVLMLHNMLNHHDLSFWKKSSKLEIMRISEIFRSNFVPISFHVDVFNVLIGIGSQSFCRQFPAGSLQWSTFTTQQVRNAADGFYIFLRFSMASGMASGTLIPIGGSHPGLVMRWGWIWALILAMKWRIQALIIETAWISVTVFFFRVGSARLWAMFEDFWSCDVIWCHVFCMFCEILFVYVCLRLRGIRATRLSRAAGPGGFLESPLEMDQHWIKIDKDWQRLTLSKEVFKVKERIISTVSDLLDDCAVVSLMHYLSISPGFTLLQRILIGDFNNRISSGRQSMYLSLSKLSGNCLSAFLRDFRGVGLAADPATLHHLTISCQDASTAVALGGWTDGMGNKWEMGVCGHVSQDRQCSFTCITRQMVKPKSSHFEVFWGSEGVFHPFHPVVFQFFCGMWMLKRRPWQSQSLSNWPGPPRSPIHSQYRFIEVLLSPIRFYIISCHLLSCPPLFPRSPGAS